MKHILEQIRQHPLTQRNKVELSVYGIVIALALLLMLLESGAAKTTWWYATIFMVVSLLALLRIASIFGTPHPAPKK